MSMLAFTMRAEADAADEKRCPTCRTRIVVPDGAGLVVRNAILRIAREGNGGATAKCPRCKTWVEVPLRYSG
jgi:phage FluMu protein Com